jgi:hypothetical protein
MVGTAAGAGNHRARCELSQPLAEPFEAFGVGYELPTHDLGGLTGLAMHLC